MLDIENQADEDERRRQELELDQGISMLERIERGELYFDIGTCIGRDDKAANELLQLAKLGAAAEKAYMLVGTSELTKPCTIDSIIRRDWYNEGTFHSLCAECTWQDFCKLRKEGPRRNEL